MKLQLCPTPEAHGASAFFRGKSRPQRFSICGRLCDPSAKTFVLFDDGIYRFDDGGLEARFFERMDALVV